MAEDEGLSLDFLTQVVNVQWSITGCRFAVCGYDGIYQDPPFRKPVYFGVGAYSDNGKTWTTFRVFEDGSAVAIFNMRNPENKEQDIVIVGGCTNSEGDVSTSTAALTTIVGSGGPSAEGGTSQGRNVANFGSIGYHKNKKEFYAVENAGDASTLHTFPFGTPNPPSSEPDEPDEPKEPQILWSGPHFDQITEAVYDCSCIPTMTFKDKDGKKRTLSITGALLLLDDEDITPPGDITSAAGGTNEDDEIIIIAVGYIVGRGTAWWSVEGRGWMEIGGLWSEEPSLQAASAATAVPNS